MFKLKKIALVLFIASTNSYASYITNGKMLTESHWIGNSNNAIHYETEINLVSASSSNDVSLGAEAKVLKVAPGYAYHTTTNHTVYIVNHDKVQHTYYWYMSSCPQNFDCITLGGGVVLNPKGEFCKSETIQPGVIYEQQGYYKNVARTYTNGYETKEAYDTANIQVY